MNIRAQQTMVRNRRASERRNGSHAHPKAWLTLLLTMLALFSAMPAVATDFTTGDLTGLVTWNSAPVSGFGTGVIWVTVPGKAGQYLASQGDGTFRFSGIEPGVYPVDVYGNGCSLEAYRLGGLPSVTVNGGEVTTSDIDISASAGRVTGSITVNGAPLSNPKITISGLCGQWQSDSLGNFVHFLPPGNYSADISGSGGHVGSMAFTIATGATTELGVVNFTTGDLTGLVTWNGDAVSGFGTGVIWAAVPGKAGQYLASRGDGTYRFAGLTPGTYAVDVYGNGCSLGAYRLGGLTSVTVNGGELTTADVDISASAGRVTGSITVNGVPLSNPKITIAGLCGQWQSDSLGNFLHFLPPGNYSASISGSGGQVGSIAFSIAPGATTELGVVNFTTGELTGLVTWNGDAVSGFGTGVIWVAVPGKAGQYLASRADGTYRFEGLAPGTYSVEVYGNGCSLEAYRLGGLPSVTVNGGEVTTGNIDLTASAGRVTGVITVNGSPLPDPRITIDGLCGRWQSDSQGNFLHFLPPGTYTADVSGSAGYVGSITFTVVAGETTELDTSWGQCGTDSDGDGTGDECDACPADPDNDIDGDGVCGVAVVDGFVAWWKGDGDATDSQGANDGEGRNGATFGSGVIGDAAFAFDGVDDYFVVPQADALNLTEGVTISAWLKWSECKHPYGWCSVVSKSPNGQVVNFSYAMTVSAAGKMAFVLGDGSNIFYAYAGPDLRGEQWRHVAVTYDESRVVYYVDGAEVFQQSLSIPLTANNSPLEIGGESGESSAPAPFSGLIDDVRLYGRALTPSEIERLASGGELAGGPDNCPSQANADQRDSDGDGLGDVCDSCPYDAANAPLESLSIALAGETAFCQTDSGGFIEATASGGGTISWQWGYRTTSGGAVTLVPRGTTASFQPQGSDFPSAGEFLMVAIATPGCGSAMTSTEVAITIYPSPDVTITTSGPTTFCDGDTVVLTASSALATSWYWSTGETTQSITVTMPGLYSVTAMTDQSCNTISDSVSVTVSPVPETPSITSTTGQGVTTLTASPAFSYLWSTGETTQSISTTRAGTYTVTAINEYGCPATSHPTTVRKGQPGQTTFSSNGVEVTFSSVQEGSTFTADVINDPESVAPMPERYYQLTTDSGETVVAAYELNIDPPAAGRIELRFYAPWVMSRKELQSIRVMHGVPVIDRSTGEPVIDPATGEIVLELVDVTLRHVYDQTDSARRYVIARVDSLSPFVLARVKSPTISSISGPVDPNAVSNSVSMAAVFTDPDLGDIHIAQWHWGDGTTSNGIVTEPMIAGGNEMEGQVTGSHTYAAAGVYSVTLRIDDQTVDGGTGTAIYQYVVVYDTDAGFVTGGGWIESPAGAYHADPSLTGRASFGFVSRYAKGAMTPSGQTRFEFRVADFRFLADFYEWLVISGPRAQYKGSGSVNGEPGYGFMLTATDGHTSGGGGVDKFRIKIWRLDTGVVVYDNVPAGGGSLEDANPQELGGGSVVIHSK